MPTSTCRWFGAAALALLLAGPASAADTGAPEVADSLSAARALIARKQWPAALEELRRVSEPTSADWNNLMGFSLRKGAAPDLDAAERHYNEALRISPKHRGALEYSGELYLMRGDLVRAEQRLATLDKACLLPCDEYTDLKKAVQRFKAGGQVPAPTR